MPQLHFQSRSTKLLVRGKPEERLSLGQVPNSKVVICGKGVGVGVHGTWDRLFWKPEGVWAVSEHVYCTHRNLFLRGFFRCSMTKCLPPIQTHHSHSTPLLLSLYQSADLLHPFSRDLLALSSPMIRKLRLLIPGFFFASCHFSFCLVLQATVTTVCYEISGSDSPGDFIVPWLPCQRGVKINLFITLSYFMSHELTRGVLLKLSMCT